MMSPPAQTSMPLAVLADDDPLQRTLMSQALQAAGYRVIAVDNGAAAIEQVRSNAPAIVFLDVQMPELTGIEACRAIRAGLGDRAPPIVVVTSCDRDEDIADGFAVGACDYLIKPVNWTVFKHRVNGWLATHVAQRDAVAQAPRRLTVARDGTVLHDSANASAAAIAGGLSELLEPAFAEQLLLCVRKALKTRAPARCSFGAYDAEVQAAGRDRATIVLDTGEQRAATAAELFKLAYLDPRTGLPNRHLLEKTALEALTQAQLRGLQMTLLCTAPAVLRVDSSSATESQLRQGLEQAAARLRAIGAVVLHDMPEQQAEPIACIDSSYLAVLVHDTAAVAARSDVIAEVTQILTRAWPPIGPGTAAPLVGRAVFPRDGTTLEALLQVATLRTFEQSPAVTLGNQRFDGDQDLPDELRADLAAELAAAVEHHQICLHYQPRVCIQSGQVLGAEALLRWQHPLRGPLVARELLRVAELTGLTARVTDWALHAAITQSTAWSQQRATRVPVSVNISAQQLAKPDFAANLIAQLAAASLDPGLLELEVGEVFLDVNDAISAQLLELRTAGVGLIVDDFGHGRVALSALRRLRIDGFKVNHALLRELQSKGDSGIYDLAASIARVRHAVLIAKGIENATELALAASKGCDQAQGFHICQPLPAAEFERFALAAATRKAAAS
ncbi:MAG TPA: EAL domain-containing protein [Steroidobacteraceae bacterium]|nr:EAL domain-containing protein [Steroidobacteraceae bacterium]HRX87863.1 EAL domain-containing protein [Steroidobacteraceae bacterium]